jgi:S-adenosylmethionine:tRNA ribosyltransferase-isomerase
MSALDYHLPPELIATTPHEPRDACRLLVVHRSTGQIEHRIFHDLPDLLAPNDLLVVNESRVLPAKLTLRKASGAIIPGLFISEPHPGEWLVMLRSRGRVAAGMVLYPAEHLPQAWAFHVIDGADTGGHWRLRIIPAHAKTLVAPAHEILGTIGTMPIPPYIQRARSESTKDATGGNVATTFDDTARYQTVYANAPGSVAAPTAGLHFTPRLLDALVQRGIQRAAVTLHVGLGTFLPVETATLEAHKMHTETYSIPGSTRHAIQQLHVQASPRSRLIAVGTTVVRTLESAAPRILAPGDQPIDDATNILISPGHRFALVDGLITNFHLPRSTLMALVAGFLAPDETGVTKLQSLYAEAIAHRYRFYSYGDAMLIL